MHVPAHNQTDADRNGLPAAHPRRPDGELPRAAVAARPLFPGDASEQPSPIRKLRVQTGAGQAGRPGARLRQRTHGRGDDGRAGTGDDLCSRHRVRRGLCLVHSGGFLFILVCCAA